MIPFGNNSWLCFSNAEAPSPPVTARSSAAVSRTSRVIALTRLLSRLFHGALNMNFAASYVSVMGFEAFVRTWMKQPAGDETGDLTSAGGFFRGYEYQMLSGCVGASKQPVCCSYWRVLL